MKQSVIVLIFFILGLISCNDDDTNETMSLNGTFSGTFTVEYFNGDSYSNPVTVIFNGY